MIRIVSKRVELSKQIGTVVTTSRARTVLAHAEDSTCTLIVDSAPLHVASEVVDPMVVGRRTDKLVGGTNLRLLSTKHVNYYNVC